MERVAMSNPLQTSFGVCRFRSLASRVGPQPRRFKSAGRQHLSVRSQVDPRYVGVTSVVTKKAEPALRSVAVELIEEPKVPLPVLTEELAQIILSEQGLEVVKRTGNVIGEERDSSAYLIYPKSHQGKNGPFPVVLFAHGFSQPPTNYLETLRVFAEQQGAIIIAPNTSIFDVLNPFKTVGGAGKSKSMATKMQAALLVDVLRSAAYLHEQGIKASKMSIMGHSMGGGLAIVTAPWLRNVDGVFVEAPAVKQLMEFPLNPYIHLASDILGRNYKEAQNFFLNVFPDKASLHLIGGQQDLVVRPVEVAKLFSAARDAVVANKLEDVNLFRVPGSHIGFEDKLSLEDSALTNNFITKIIFGVVNFLVYKVEILKALLQDPSNQVAAARLILSRSLDAVLDPSQPFPPQETSAEAAYDITITTGKGDKVPISGYNSFKQLSKDEQDEIDIIWNAASQLPADEDPSKDPPSVWLPATTLLVGYTVGQAINCFSAAKLVVEGWPFLGNLDSNGGMALVAALAFALVYENALLAGGRFIGQSPLLQALSQYRFVGHAFAPTLAFVAAEMAARGGVTWATQPAFEGFIGFTSVVVPAISLLTAFFLLDTKVLYERGIVRYGYRDDSFIKVLPVISATVVCIALGLAGKDATPALAPLAFGPIASFVLAAVPSKLAPTFIAGNLGEVILLASLVAAETGLRASGL